MHIFKIGLFKVQMPISMKETNSLVLNCFKKLESNLEALIMGANVVGLVLELVLALALLTMKEFGFWVEWRNPRLNAIALTWRFK